MKATAFFSSTVAILFSSTLFLAGCAGLAGVSSSAPPSPTATSAPPPPPPPPSGAPTSTFVYVLSNPGSNNFEINAFSADANGQLTPVPGSPFAANVHAMAANQKYLFGTDGANIDSFSIAPNGALTQLSSINIRQFNPQGGLGNLFPDRTGTSLYAAHARIDGANDGYDLFSVDNSTGALTYVGVAFTFCCGFGPLSFSGNNLYVYTTSCFHGFAEISTFKRNNDGTLTPFGAGFTFPDPKRTCPEMVAPDASNHLAISFGGNAGPGVPPQDPGIVLAVYTVDGSGNVTTSSTVANMPQTKVGGRIVISPSGKFLAVAGLGLEVFHFNGADPITPFAGLLTSDRTDQIAWANDLFAISQSTNKLSVFTVDDTSATEAPGSPYTITNPSGIVVVPRM